MYFVISSMQLLRFSELSFCRTTNQELLSTCLPQQFPKPWPCTLSIAIQLSLSNSCITPTFFPTQESGNNLNWGASLTKHVHHPHRPAYRWSRSTSKEGGITPSAPCPPRYSNKEAANALAAAHDKMEYHRLLHACSMWRCNRGDLISPPFFFCQGPNMKS